MPPEKNQQPENSSHLETEAKSSKLALQPTAPVMLLKRTLPRASVEKAQKMFKNFSLSKFTKDSLPANHVGEAKQAGAVRAAQRAIISKQIETLNASDATNPGMILALPAETINSVLPSYDEKAGTVELSDVLTLLTKKMNGTQFYANGNPTLNRLVLQSQVDQIIQSIRQEAKK